MNIGEVRSTPNPSPQTHHAPKASASREAGQEKNEAPAAGDRTGETHEVFSAAETKYFEGLFPQSAKEIRSYATYRKEGNTPPAVLGSIIDRKG